MMVPGLEVEQMFKNVRVKVLRDTRERQLPWVNTSLTSNFSFNPARDAQPAIREQPAREAAQKPPAREPAGRRFEPNELEKQLERAQRELDARATASPQAQPPAPAQPVAPQVARPSPPPAPCPASRSAVASREQHAGTAFAHAQVPGPRRDGATPRRQDAHTLKDIGAGYLMRWDMRSSGPHLLQQPEHRQREQQRLGPLGTEERRQPLRPVQPRAAGPADRRAQARRRLLVFLPRRREAHARQRHGARGTAAGGDREDPVSYSARMSFALTTSPSSL
jgi:hypothetical protein